MSLLTVQAFEAVVGTGMDEDALQDVIDREEAELAHLLGGALEGERTETYRPGPGYDGPIWLRRFTDAVTATDDGTELAEEAVRLLARGGAIERADGAWQGDIVVTYTPSDEARIVRALIELVRDAVVPDRDRQAGSARLSTEELAARRRSSLVRALRPRPGSTTIAVRTTDRLTPVVP